jgi:hypothetical protein
MRRRYHVPRYPELTGIKYGVPAIPEFAEFWPYFLQGLVETSEKRETHSSSTKEVGKRQDIP